MTQETQPCATHPTPGGGRRKTETNEEKEMTITFRDPILRKEETREANPTVSSCAYRVFGVLSATGNRVDLFVGDSFFDKDKRFAQRVFFKTPFAKCSMDIDGIPVTCLGVAL